MALVIELRVWRVESDAYEARARVVQGLLAGPRIARAAERDVEIAALSPFEVGIPERAAWIVTVELEGSFYKFTCGREARRSLELNRGCSE